MTMSKIDASYIEDGIAVSKTALRQTLLTIQSEIEHGGFTRQPASSFYRTSDAKHADTVSIFDFGAVGDDSTDDALSIQAAFEACALSGKALWFPSGHTFAVSSALVADGSFSIIMDGKLRKTNNSIYTVLHIGQTSRPTWQFRPQYFKIGVVVLNGYDWTNTGIVGVEFCNVQQAMIHVHDVEGFHTGILFSGRGQGNAYNHVVLGRIANNKVGLRLAAEDGGFVNENQFFDGSWQMADHVNAGEEVFGIVLDHFAPDQPVFDNNVFQKPAIEIGNGGLRSAVPLTIIQGDSNKFFNVRAEGNNGAIAVIFGQSRNNVINTFGQPASGERTVVTDTSTSPSTTLETHYHIGPKQAAWHTISGLSHRSIGTGGGQLTCTGAAFCSWGTGVGTLINSQKSDSHFSLTRSGLRIGSVWSGLTVRVRTNATKKIWIKRCVGQNVDGRTLDGAIHGNSPYVRCFDSAGKLLSGTETYYARFGPSGTSTFVQGGGGYRSAWSIDPDYPNCVEFHPDVAFADLGISGSGIADGFSITTDNGLSPQIDTPWAHDMAAFADVEPDQGYFWTGRVIWRLAPAHSQPMGWVCTAAGWRARAWTPNTMYLLWQLVTNDSGKVYECKTAGSSAESLGPAGTGSTITDGGVTWAYVGQQASFVLMPNLQ